MKDKIITLENGEKKVISDTFEFNNMMFCLATNLISDTDEINENFEIYQVIKNSEDMEIIDIENEELKKMLLDNFIVKGTV